mgnify:FL=1
MNITAMGKTFTVPDGSSPEQIAEVLDHYAAKQTTSQQTEDIPQVDAEGNTSFGEGGVEVSKDHATTVEDAFMSLVSGMNSGAVSLANLPTEGINAVYRTVRRAAGEEVAQSERLTANPSDLVNMIPGAKKADGTREGLVDTALRNPAVTNLERGLHMFGEVATSGAGFTGGVRNVATHLDDIARLKKGTSISKDSAFSGIARDPNFVRKDNISNIGAATGGGLATTIAPDSVPTQMLGMLAGGMVRPPKFMAEGTEKARKAIIDPWTDKGVAERTAAKLREYTADTGAAIDSIDDNGKLFREVFGDDVVIPTTVLANDPGLTSAYIRMATDDPALGKIMQTYAGEADKLILKAVQSQQKGSVGAQAAVDSVNVLYARLNSQLESRISAIQKQSDDMLAGIGSGVHPEETSNSFRAGLENMHLEYGKVEKQLWQAVPEAKDMDFNPIQSMMGDLRRSSSKAAWTKMPKEAIDRMIALKGVGDMREVLDTRKIILELGRKAKAEGNGSEAYLLREVEEILGKYIDAPFGPVSTEYRRAASMTRRKHEVFTQGSIGDLRGYSKAGDMASPPETTLSRLTPGKEAGARTGKDINIAAGGDALESVPANPRLIELTEQYVGDKFSAFADTPSKRAAFLSDKQFGPLLRQFPDLNLKLNDVSGELGKLADESARLEGRFATRNDKNKHYAARMLGTDPLKVPSVLKNMQEGDVVKLMRLLGRDSNAVQGLRNSVLDDLVGKLINTRGETGGVFLESLYLKDPQLKRVVDTVLTKEQAAGLHKIDSVVKANSPKRVEGAAPNTSDAVKNSSINRLVARVLGARMGAKAASGGSSILAANAMANFSEGVANEATKNRVNKLLVTALQDPKIMKELLRPVTTAEQALKANERLRGYLIHAGFSEDEK